MTDSAAMAFDARSCSAELSSLATVLEDVTRRVTSTAERLQADKQEDIAASLFEVERSLRAAERRLYQARKLTER